MTTATDAPTNAAPATEATTIDYGAIAQGMEAVETKPAEQQQVETKPVEQQQQQQVETKAEPVEKDAMAVGFEKLVAKQAEFRKEMEAAKPALELAKALTPMQTTALVEARAKNDVLGVLSALGLSYNDVAKAVVGASDGRKPAPVAPKPKEEPEVEQKPEDEVTVEMRAEYLRQKQQRQQQAILDEIGKVVGANKSKLELVATMEAAPYVLRVLEEMYSSGGFPTDNATDNIRIAAEEVEKRLTKQKERWSKVLTPGAQPGNNAQQAPVAPAETGQTTPGKTLTNKLAAPVAPAGDFDPEATIARLASDKGW